MGSVQPEPVVDREEVTAMLFVVADLNANARAICRQEANQERLERVIQRRLERDGTTREEIWRRLGLCDRGHRDAPSPSALSWFPSLARVENVGVYG
jgi:hypothetical protein